MTMTPEEKAEQLAEKWWDEGSINHTFGPAQEAELARAIREAVEEERATCLRDIEGERLSGETDDEGDKAYNMALEHAAEAIRERPAQPASQEVGSGEAQRAPAHGPRRPTGDEQ